MAGARHLSTVEVNNTFHRMPSRSVLERWGQSVTAGFVFALKAPQRITHHKRLPNVGEDVEWLCRTASVLGPSLGPVLFQLPPHLPKDLARLAALLDALPSEIRAQEWQESFVYFKHEEDAPALAQRMLALAG